MKMVIKLADSVGQMVGSALASSKIAPLSKIEGVNPKAISVVKSFKVPSVIKSALPAVKAFK